MFIRFGVVDILNGPSPMRLARARLRGVAFAATMLACLLVEFILSVSACG